MNTKKTILYDIHESSGAKIAPFAGYLMPIQYRGIIAEHMATRNRATVFDTCHMGEFHICGGSVLADLENILTCRVSAMEIGQCRYGFICNYQGGAVDDQVIYRLGENDFFMVVNAATQETDFQWIESHLSKATQIEDVSDKTAKIDLQGPQSARIMQKLMEERIDDMKFYHFKYNRYKGSQVLASRTGYTGEIGFEIYCDKGIVTALWNDCIENGAEPAGLGARNTLRLEMGFPLYGHELSPDRNVAESGLLRYIAANKEFIGSPVVLDESQREFSLVAMILDDRRAARAHDTLLDAQGREIGFITSGSFSPSLGKAIVMGYTRRSSTQPGTGVTIKTERYELKGIICKTPLYKGATGRKNLKEFLEPEE